MVSHYIRGGQIFLHKIRMFAQVWYKNLLFATILASIVAFYIHHQKFSIIEFHSTKTYAKALLTSKIDLMFQKETATNIAAYSQYGIYAKNIPNHKILSHPFFKRKFQATINILYTAFIDFLYIFLLFYCLLITIWHLFGKFASRINIIEGRNILKDTEVNKILKREKMKSIFQLGTMHLVKNSESSHILFTGTTGTGKTSGIKQLIHQIRKVNNRAIIIDYNGQFSQEFYQEGDYIIGTKDYCWDLLEDIRDPDNLSNVANAIFDGKGGNYDEMWNNASKSFFTDCANITLQKQGAGADDLYNMLAKIPLKKLHQMLKGCASHSMLDPSNEKTALSIRTNTIAYLDWLKQIKSTLNKISLVNWIKAANPEDGRWLFLKSTPKERSSLRSLYAIMLDLIINQIMELGENPHRRIWMIIDELPSLKKIPSLETALFEFRKYGGCIVSSAQSLHQLFDIYGSSKAYAMIDQFNTKFVFRSDEYNFANYLCKGLGDLKYIEKSENYSYGSHEIRDGVNISSIEKSKALITPKDIANLDNFECYSILPYSKVKIAKIKIR